MRAARLPRRPRRRLPGLVRDTGWTGAGEGVKLVTGLVVLNVLIVGLGPAGYGRYVAVQALSALLMTLSSVWVIFLLLQRTLQEQVPLREAFAQCLGIATATSVLAFGLGTAVGPSLVPGLSRTVVACFVAAELLGGVLLLMSAAAVQVADGLPAAMRVRILQVLTRFSVVLGIALAGRADLRTLAVWLLVGYAVVGGVVFWRTTGRLDLPRLPRRPVRRDVREGSPYAGVLAALAVQEDSDKVFLVRFADAADAGVYAAAYRLVQLGFLPINALMGSSHPRFLGRSTSGRGEHLRRALRYTGPTALYGVVAVLGIVLVAPFVPALLGEDYAGTPGLLMALAPLVLLRALSLFPLNALLGLKRFRLRFAAIAGCMVLAVVLNGALIPVVGVPGAVASTLATELVLVLVAWACVLRSQRQADAVAADNG